MLTVVIEKHFSLVEALQVLHNPQSLDPTILVPKDKSFW
jgi:hypothetical protein